MFIPSKCIFNYTAGRVWTYRTKHNGERARTLKTICGRCVVGDRYIYIHVFSSPPPKIINRIRHTVRNNNNDSFLRLSNGSACVLFERGKTVRDHERPFAERITQVYHVRDTSLLLEPNLTRHISARFLSVSVYVRHVCARLIYFFGGRTVDGDTLVE